MVGPPFVRKEGQHMNQNDKQTIKCLMNYIGCTDRLAEDLYLLANKDERLVKQAYDATTHLTACKTFIINERLNALANK